MTTSSESDGQGSPQTGLLSPALNDLILSMQPISLGEMDKVALMKRVDTKFVLSEKLLPELLSLIRSDYRILKVEEKLVSQYETLYFDTPDFRSYIQHQNGKLNRHKVRMRKYLSSGACFLEVKMKNNKKRTNKRRVAIPDIQETLSPEHVSFIQSITGSSEDLQPALWTCFSRITLVGCHHTERVTLDLGLTFRNSTSSQQLPGVVIAEVKQASHNRSSSPICQQLHELYVRQLRVSKYCLGTMLLNPRIKQNRFKAKLLAIRKLTS